MVVPAMQLASKIPDMSVQLWSSALLKGTSGQFELSITLVNLYNERSKRQTLAFLTILNVPADLNKALGNTMDAHEAAQMHQNFSQQLLQDHIAACSLPEHNLISVGHMDSCAPPPICENTVITVFLSVCSGQTAPLLSRSKLRTGPPPALPACYETAAVRLMGSDPRTQPEQRKESIILSSRLLHHCLLSYLNCYKTIPVIVGVFRATWRHGEAVGTQGGADLHHTIKVAKDSDV